MQFWKVTTKFYDNGTVKAAVDFIEADSKPANETYSREKYDLYCDYFDSQKEASDFFQQALNA